jgi:two-component system, OmpR family, sensor kinase
VEQLLVLARQEASEVSGARNQNLELADVARRAVAEMAAAAQVKRIDLGLQRADPAQVTGQPDALHILMRNLVDNAIKYTPVGGIIDVQVCAGADGPSLCVEDSGPGIAADERERVFDRFYRIAGSEASGSGLGLAIIKAIAERHGAVLTLGQSERLGGLSVKIQFAATSTANA